MDIASVIGVLLGFLLLAGSVAITQGASFSAFFDIPSLVMVLGGSVAAVMVCFPLRAFFAGLGAVRKIFFSREPDLPALVEQLVSLAETARRDGLLALESQAMEIDNPFVAMGVQLAVDGSRPELIESILRTEMEGTAARHRAGKAVMDQFGRFGPAFGMIGTLVGLIIMLRNMNDPDAIGPGMAVAMITTLYGAVLANLLCLPFAEKLAHISKRELLAMEVVVRGILAIQSGENPRMVAQRLNTFLPRGLRKYSHTEAA